MSSFIPAPRATPVSGRPLSGWQGLINQPRGEAANAAIGKTASTKKTSVKKIEIPGGYTAVWDHSKVPDGFTVAFSVPQGSLSWVTLIKRDPWT